MAPVDTPVADSPNDLAGLPRERWPRHIAVIMDGNGRWAQQRSLPRIEGHRRGVNTVRRVTEECARLKLEQLTLYCLSSENWKRPQHELDFLMHLLEQYLIEERQTLLRENIRLSIIGRRDGIPDSVQAAMDGTIALTREHTGLKLCLAVNYGGRMEVTDAVREIARRAAAGEIDPADIDEQTVSEHLYTAGMSDPDLLIRTAGELRVSNFLLWQISYAELWVSPLCWPEFDEAELHAAIRSFAGRDRRYGGLNS